MSTRTPRPAGGWNRLSVPPPGWSVPSGRRVSALTRAWMAARQAGRGQRIQAQGIQGRAVGHAERELDEVQAGDLFCDRVLDLEPGVDLEKGDRVRLDEELDGGQAGVTGRADQRPGGLGQPRADRVPDHGRRDLD